MHHTDVYKILNAALQRPIAFHRVFRVIGGSAVAGLFLSQCWYWKDKGRDPEKWFYKTQAEWEQETGLSRKEQETARKALKSLGFLQEELKGIPAQMYYKLDEDAIISAILKTAETPDKFSLPDTSKQDCGEIVRDERGRYSNPMKSSLSDTSNLDFSSLPDTSKQASRYPANYLYTENTQENRNKENAFLSNEEDPEEEEEPTPLPPSRDLAAEYAALKAKEDASWSKNRVQRSGNGWVYPWNENRNPREINSEFVQWLVDRQVPFIHFNYNQTDKLTEEIVIAHCRKLAQPDKREKYQADMIEAWEKFTRERDAKAAREEDRKRRDHDNHPDNNARYKRFSHELEKLKGFRVEAIRSQDYSNGLRVKLFHDSQAWEFYSGKFDYDVAHNLHRFWNNLRPASKRVEFERFIQWFDSQVFREWERERAELLERRFKRNQERGAA